jgi:hypothetical protein
LRKKACPAEENKEEEILKNSSRWPRNIQRRKLPRPEVILTFFLLFETLALG